MKNIGYILLCFILSCLFIISLPVYAAEQKIVQQDTLSKNKQTAPIIQPIETTNEPVEFDGFLRSRFESLHEIPDLSIFSQCDSFQEIKRLNPGDTFTLKGHYQSGSQTNNDFARQNRRIKLLADSVPENSLEITYLKGNVKFSDESSIMRADSILFNHEKQSLVAEGGVSYESEDAFFKSDSLVRTEQSEKLEMDRGQFYVFSNNANGVAEKITVDNNKQIQLKDLSFSTCPATQQSWLFSTSEMNIDPNEGVGSAWNTVLRIGDVPVFYLPYIRFRIDDRRETGILPPTIKRSDYNGLDFTQPIYFNIAPWIDATLFPRHIELRGFQIGKELRLLTEKTYTELNFEWMDNDKKLARATTSINSDEKANRWMGSLKNDSQFNNKWRANIRAAKVSDTDYFRDFSSGLEGANETRLSSELNVYYEDEIWQMRWFALSHQSLIGNQTYRYLPSWTTSADYMNSAGFRWQFLSDITRFEHKNENRMEGTRAVIYPRVSYPMTKTYGYLTPQLGLHISQFDQQSQLTQETNRIDRQLPIFSLDSGLYFDRDTSFNQVSYVHSLIPKVRYTYIPFEDQSKINNFDTGIADFSFQQLWRDNRFTGLDRIGDTNQVSIALSNTLTNQESGQEVVNFQVGRIFYLEDRKVQLGNSMINQEKYSPWLVQTDLALNNSWSISNKIEWDETNRHTNKAETRINFEPSDNNIVNLSHRYRDIVGQQVEEIDFSFAWALNEQWRIVGRWYNDIRQSKTIEAMVGFEYESCCWAIRLVGQRFLNTQLDSLGQPILIDDNYNDGIYLQFVFKGLGSAGQSGVGNMLSTSIPGYDDRFARKRLKSAYQFAD